MPWCQHCDRFLSPPTVREDGTCPTCDELVDAGRARVATSEPHADGTEVLPWHLWVLLAALVVYLGFRFWQGIEWLWSALS